ncbi:Uncharacterised protein [Candidatus Norongarragalina meridionalis]|nr:Uncharacterised protein [Candidatus Norongarragalina meridionalis]
MLAALLFFDEVFSTLGELDFVVRVMVFSYMLFWLYMTFKDAQLLFGIATIVVGYLIFVHGVSVTIVVVLWLIFFLLGSQLQMLMLFGVLPLLGYQQAGGKYVKESELMGGGGGAAQELEAKVKSGQASQQEQQALQEMYAQEQMQQQQMQRGRMRAGM